MNNNSDAIGNIKTEKLLSIIFIIIGLANIFGDNLLIKSINNNDKNDTKKAENIFLIGLIVSLIIYIVIVSRNYKFYVQKKNSGDDATLELIRFFGSILILVGFLMIFYYFLKDDNLASDDPPVL